MRSFHSGAQINQFTRLKFVCVSEKCDLKTMVAEDDEAPEGQVEVSQGHSQQGHSKQDSSRRTQYMFATKRTGHGK